jgi:hypothetical protein
LSTLRRVYRCVNFNQGYQRYCERNGILDGRRLGWKRVLRLMEGRYATVEVDETRDGKRVREKQYVVARCYGCVRWRARLRRSLYCMRRCVVGSGAVRFAHHHQHPQNHSGLFRHCTRERRSYFIEIIGIDVGCVLNTRPQSLQKYQIRRLSVVLRGNG